MNRFKIAAALFAALAAMSAAGQAPISLAVLKYGGGGDWYANPTSVPNLARYANSKLGIALSESAQFVEPGSPDIFSYPFIHMTGHGNVILNQQEAGNLRRYLLSGGFLHIDDNFGIDNYVRREMKKVFPDADFVELPLSHPIYSSVHDFKAGLPKIHEHENNPPQGFGIIWQGRLVCFYSYEADLGDGWEDQSVHNNPEEIREKALKMGVNILAMAFLY
jgi:hypothetical protein